MRNKIKQAILSTLVVENKQSIDLAVDKIFTELQKCSFNIEAQDGTKYIVVDLEEI